MRIRDLLAPESIQLNGTATGKEDVLNQMVSLMVKSGKIADEETYRKGVFAREEESTTGIGEGIAIPHCKSAAVKKPGLSAMVLKDGVDFDALDGEKVHLIFLIAAPDTEDNVHLDVLSRLSVLLMDENFTNGLKQAASVEEFLKVIDEAESEKEEKEELDHQKKVGLLVITGDKGLAGAYNHNVLKLAQEFLDDQDQWAELFVVGELGRQYFTGQHVPIQENFQFTAQNPTFSRARWIAETLLEKFQSGELDEIQVIFTRMENSMTSVAEVRKMLPMERPPMPKIPMDVYHEEFLAIPDAQTVVDSIVPNYISGFIYSALVESFCSEQNARMQAMESATNNADELLHDLSIMYNRARQAAITQEITEVCSGARAQKNKKQ